MNVNLGCGKDIKKGWINVDRIKAEGIDVVHNLDNYPYPFKDNSVDYIYADNVLEHLEDVDKVLRELHRISKPNATVHIKVPYYNSINAIMMLEHKHFFCENSLKYYWGQVGRNIDFEQLFYRVKVNMIPTKLGRLIPKRYRATLAHIIGEVISEVEFILEVKKQTKRR